MGELVMTKKERWKVMPEWQGSRRNENISELFDSSQLHGLQQPAYILECLQQGLTENQIIQLFDGDRQLVRMWLCFILHNHWANQQSIHDWLPTEKGQLAIERYLYAANSKVGHIS
jgi:hypothetical protein